MRGRVPPADGQVQSAGKSNLIVDHHDLLVLRATKRSFVIEAELNLVGRASVERVLRKQLTLEGIEH